MKTTAQTQKELTDLLRPTFLRSAKFRAWGKTVVISGHFGHTHAEIEPTDGCAVSKHFSPTELAQRWGVSAETVRSIFRAEPGVLKIGKPGTKHRRPYYTLRIPLEVAERVHRKLSE